jgi:hypothetical protein
VIRMMHPDGTMCNIPESAVSEAEAAGYKVMTDNDMTQMFNRIAMADRLFQRDWKKRHRPISKPLRFLRT